MTKNKMSMKSIAILGLIATIAVPTMGSIISPTISAWIQNKPLIEISFGNETNYPQKELQPDGIGYYYSSVVGTNKGVKDTPYTVTIVGTNAVVSFDGSNWYAQTSNSLMMWGDSKFHVYQFHVAPNQNVQSFSILISQQRSLFEDAYTLNPVQLTYKLNDGKWFLVS